MTSNSGQHSAARGLVPLSILAALLVIALAAYLSLSGQPMASELPASVLEAETSSDKSEGGAMVSMAQENSTESNSEGDAGSATNEDDSAGDASDADSADEEGAEDAEDEVNAEDSGAGAETVQDSAESTDDEQAQAIEAESSDDGAETDSTDSDDGTDANEADANEADANEADTVSEEANIREANVIVGTYKGMPVGYTEDGLVFRGEPDAPVTIFEYSDYQCPFCLRHFSQTETALNEAYVETGKAKFVFVDFPLVQLHPNAPAASAAALCVAEQDPVAFWEMHALVFETQNQWSNSPDPIAFFQDLGASLEIDQTAYTSCLESGRADAMIERSYAMGRSLGFSGTPSFQFVMDGSEETYNLVGAQPYDKFSSWIDAMAVGEAPADAVQQSDDTAQAGNQELPYWATEEGLAPDPEREGFTMAGDPYRGSVEAPIVVIEYSDFQCPFCRRHTETTQPVLDEQFVDTEQVRWVFRHFPLNIHAQAPAAGVAAECAGEQGQFWEMHALLFNDMQGWSISEPNPRFVELATQLELDTDAFATCLSDESMMARIDSDFADGRQFVQGTPTFIIMSGGQGRLIPGALPADTFSQAIQQVIDSAQ